MAAEGCGEPCPVRFVGLLQRGRGAMAAEGKTFPSQYKPLD